MARATASSKSSTGAVSAPCRASSTVTPTLVLRATLPAFRNPGEQKHLLALFLVSSAAGQPVEGASVQFVPVDGGPPAFGTTDASGVFTLTTFKQGDGARKGEYKVTVTKMSDNTVTFDVNNSTSLDSQFSSVGPELTITVLPEPSSMAVVFMAWPMLVRRKRSNRIS